MPLALYRYLQMWRRKLTLDELALRSHISRSTLHDTPILLSPFFCLARFACSQLL
jgi:hypothetical protein